MAFGIESRVPFLDYRIVELAFSISNDIKFFDGDYKYILRKIGAAKLPDSLLKRKDKYGFTSNDFFDNKSFQDFFRSNILSENIRNSSLVNYSNVEETLNSTNISKLDTVLWRVFNFSVWLNARHS